MNNDFAIAHVLTSLSVGGGERMALLLAAAQRRRGHAVSVISLAGPGPLADEFEEAGVPVRSVIKRPHGLDPSLAWRIVAELRRSGARVVHTHNQLPLIYAALPGRICGARVLHTEHGSHEGGPGQRLLRRAVARVPHTFVCVSDATASYVAEQLAIDRGRLSVILNATDLQRFEREEARRSALRESWGAGPDHFVVGTVGRMAEVKNHPLLLRAVAPLLGEHTLLVFVGDGEKRAATEALARELGVVEHCRFLGEVRDVPAILSGFDLFALSSHSEGLPMALAEAMGASLPVVATAVGGVPKVVSDGETGFIVPAGDEAAMRARIDELRADRSRAEELGARGLQLARERYSLDRMTNEYLAAYGVLSH